ncbi:tol-pal system protein YbgF [Hyphomicrobium sp. 99]|uniref:tol-pal system protein YbgF n=1 Tax=Hyphomicrobium sp. 99 TaxID=1163419 RepID=UPI0005F83AF9|nr:tol-pal system protein YbgF [Hyphomicrobium sp. 99]
MAKLAGILRSGLRFQIVALAFALSAVPALAQSSDTRPSKAGAAAAAAAASSGDAGLKARVQALEEQLVDMQVVVGTLESLAKNGGSAAAPFPSSGGAVSADPARIEGLETQVRALSLQVQQLSDQVRSMGGVPRRSEIQGGTDVGAVDHADAGAGGFGSTTVSPGPDAIGGLLDANGQPEADRGGSVAGSPAPVATAALPTASEPVGDPKQLYETAYGYLLQRDYGSAETAFNDFLKKFPNDSLSGNAQYWLGETYFVRGQYKAAASSFLKGYSTYAQSGKAPDSLLKLAMSLDRLGQKEAACSSFSELASKFPTAAPNVKARAQSERQRIGCQ